VVVNRRRTGSAGGIGGQAAARGLQAGTVKPGHASREMGKLTLWFVAVVVLAALGGAVFLALWNPPAPSVPVEKVLPNARFPK
jgi:hypothetical protein